VTGPPPVLPVGGAGRVLMNRFARDSRKWNGRVMLSSQIPADFLRIQGFVTLLDSVFVGRLDDEIGG